MPSPVRYMSALVACGNTALPETSVATRKITGRNAFPPKMSLIASLLSPSRTAANPVETSGNAVTAARIVAPKDDAGHAELFGDRLACLLENHAGDQRGDSRNH